MYRKYFGDTLYAASTNQELLSTYSSTQGDTKYVMVINKSRDTKYTSKVEIGAGTYNLELYSFGRNSTSGARTCTAPWSTKPR
jgi:hypothetical protein